MRYDHVAPIRDLYSGFRGIVYDVGYTARENRIGKRPMFFSPRLAIPVLVGPIRQVGEIPEAA
jgi:DNA adenine methylase